MAANNSRGVLKFNGGAEQKVLKLNYSVSRSTDVSGRRKDSKKFKNNLTI
nr:hypothetical protein [Kaistella jeonii]